MSKKRLAILLGIAMTAAALCAAAGVGVIPPPARRVFLPLVMRGEVPPTATPTPVPTPTPVKPEWALGYSYWCPIFVQVRTIKDVEQIWGKCGNNAVEGYLIWEGYRDGIHQRQWRIEHWCKNSMVILVRIPNNEPGDWVIELPDC